MLSAVPDWVFIAVAVVLAALVSAQLLNRLVRGTSVFAKFFVVWRTRRPLALIRSMAHHAVFAKIAYAGIFLGFGAIAFDYFYFKKHALPARLALFSLATALLSLCAYLPLSMLMENLTIFPAWAPLAISLSFGLFGMAGFVLSNLAFQGQWIITQLISGERAIAGIAPVIPGVQLPNVPIFIPLHGWISLFILLVVHEGFHGVLMARYKVPIRSTGLLIAGFLPIGAFVEPDEKVFQKKPKRPFLEVLSGGPTSNFLLFVLLIPLALGLGVVATGPALLDHPQVTVVAETLQIDGAEVAGPAFEAGIPVGAQVVAVNGVPVSTTQAFMEHAGDPSDPVTLQYTDESGSVSMATLERQGGLVGISLSDYDYSLVNPWLFVLYEFVLWLMLLNFFAAVANFLPVEPFDGGKMVKPLLAPYVGFLGLKNRAHEEKFVGRALLWIVGILVIVNILPLFVF